MNKRDARAFWCGVSRQSFSKQIAALLLLSLLTPYPALAEDVPAASQDSPESTSLPSQQDTSSEDTGASSDGAPTVTAIDTSNESSSGAGQMIESGEPTDPDPFVLSREALKPQNVSTDQMTGALTYTYALDLPKGRNGMQPDITLTYSSQPSYQDSLVGYGWSLNIPYIERTNKIGTDKLYNQDRDHTYFTSSLSGELLPVVSTSTVASYLGLALAAPFLSFLSFPRLLASLDVTSSDESSTIGDTGTSTVDTVPTGILSPLTPITPLVFAMDESTNSSAQDRKFEEPDLFMPNGKPVEAAELVEIENARTQNSQKFLVGANEDGSEKYMYRFTSLPEFARDKQTGRFEPIDSRLQKGGNTYAVANASYELALAAQPGQPIVTMGHDGFSLSLETPKTADDAIRNAKSQADGVYKEHRVTYPDYFGEGIDLEFTANDFGVREDVVVRNAQALEQAAKDGDLPVTFQFSVNRPFQTTVGSESLEEDEQISTSTSAELVDDWGNRIGILPPLAYWGDDADITGSPVTPITITYSKKGSTLTLVKHLSVIYQSGITFPVRFDAVFTFGGGTGDGYAYSVAGLPFNTWSQARDGSAGNLTAVNGGGTSYLRSSYIGHCCWSYSYDITRHLMPIDTSALSDTEPVASAILYLKPYDSGSVDNASATYFTIVGTTTQATTTSVTWSDFNHVGSLDNPDRWTDKKQMWNGTWGTSTEFVGFPFNATGTRSVNRVGYTMLGMRTGHDIENITPTQVGDNYWRWFSSYADPNDRPYLAVWTDVAGPLRPTGLLTIGQGNPTFIATSSLYFSAIAQGASSTDVVTDYQIQVTASSTSWSNLVWDSGRRTLASSTVSGSRTPNISSTSTFPFYGKTYYWRIKFWNQAGGEGLWSNTGDRFTMDMTGDYRAKTENGNFTTYSFSLDDRWTAVDKKGARYSFGQATTSRVESGATTTFRWYVNEVRDSNGNKVAYNYTQDGFQSYPSSITYTDTDSGVGSYEVRFVYEDRPDIATSSYSGYPVVTKQRMKEILVRVNGQLVRRYQLGYTTGDNTKRSLLSSVQRSGRDAAYGTTTMPTTSFAYATSTAGWTQATSTQWVLPGPLVTNSYDQGYRIIDADGDGLPDVLYGIWSGGYPLYHYYRNTGSNWTQDDNYWTTPYPFTGNSGTDQGVRFTDINGDQLTDFAEAPYDYTRIVYINNGTSTWVASSTWVLPYKFTEGGTADTGARLVDVNGDGLADIVYGSKCTYTGCSLVTAVYINTGSSWELDQSWSFPVAIALGGRDAGTRLLDVNGDGLIDIVVAFSNQAFEAYLNNGHGWTYDAGWSASVPGAFTNGVGDYGFRFADLNSDGLPDVVHTYDTGYPNYTRIDDIFLNTGSGWANAASQGWNSFPERIAWDLNNYGVEIVDIDGDGLPDVVRSDGYAGSEYKKSYLHAGIKPDLIKEVRTEQGGRYAFAYQATPELRTSSGQIANPKLPQPMDVVRTVVFDPGFGGAIATTTYNYEGGKYYARGVAYRKFSGFASTTATDSLGDKTVTYFHQGDGTNSMLGEYNDDIAKWRKSYRVETYSPSGGLLSRVINKWARADYGDGRNFVKLIQSLAQTFEGDSTHRDTVASTTYDDLTGDIATAINLGEVSGNSDGTWTDVGTDLASTTYSYAASTTNTVMSLPSRELVTDQSGVTVRDTKWYYDSLAFGSVSKGNQTKEEKLKSGSTYISTQKTYDAYGNVLTAIDARGATTTLSYDSYNLYPATSTNPLGQTRTFAYDYSSGKVTTTTDENGLTVVTEYDGLDRPIREKEPDLASPSTLVTKTDYTYTDSTTTPSSVFRRDYLTSATATDLYTYFDGLGRTIQTKKEAETANGWTTKDTVYNTIGSVGKESLPYFTTTSSYGTATTAPALFTNYAYDAAGRVLTVANAVGTTTNTYSDWRLTVTDPLGTKKDLGKDAYGNLANVVEYPSAGSPATTTYAWDLNKKLTKITDALGNIRNFTYDNLGRLLTSQDLHASADTTYGTSTYTYDDNGNVLTFLNPRNQTTNYAYDALNRTLTEDYTGGSGTEIQYTYDACTYGKMHLCKALVQGSATTTYAYNALGLLAAETEHISGIWSTTTYSYLRSGAQSAIAYPDRTLVGYTYDPAGLLDKVTKREPGDTATSSVILGMDYAPTEQPTIIRYGNGATTTNTYDKNALYRLASKVTTLLGGTKAQDLAYTYNALGNITRIVDNSDTLTKKTLDFTYDALSRLLTASSTNVSSGTNYLQQFAYDALGNILSGPAGSYTYGQTSYANPDAVTALVTMTTTTGTTTTYSTSTPALVQSALDTTNAEVSFPSAVTSGNLVVVGLTFCCTTLPSNDISDNKGNTYTKIGEVAKDDDHGALFYAKNVTGGSSFTVTSQIGGSLTVLEYSGIATSSPFDKVASSTGSGTSLTSGNLTTAVGNELIVGLAWSWEDGDSWTAGSGYTLRTQETNNATLERHATEDRVLTSAGSTAATFTVPTSNTWLDIAAAFKPLVTASTTSSGSTSYATTTLTYDQAGNLLTSGANTYQWNYRNRLTLSGNGIATSTYTYDQNDRRMSLTSGGYTTLFPNMYFSSTTGSLGTTTKYIYANGALVAAIDSTPAAGTASATPALVQSALDTTNAQVTFPSAVTSGNLVVVGLTFCCTTLPPNDIADNKGNTYTKIGEVAKDDDHGTLFYAKNVTGGSNFTVTSQIGGSLTVLEYSGMSTTSPFDKVASSTGSGTSLTSGNFTTTGNNELAVALAWSMQDGDSWTAGSGYTLRTQVTDNATLERHATEDRILTSPTTTAATFSVPTSNTWLDIVALFKAASVSGGGSGSTIHYMFSDPLQSTSVVTDQSGSISETLDYYPYGDIRLDQKSGSYQGERRKYIGQVYDAGSGLNYLNARYQNGAQGRFISEDPLVNAIGTGNTIYGRPQSSILANPQELNTYSYALGNPINKSDPKGLGMMGMEYAFNNPDVPLEYRQQLYDSMVAFPQIVTGTYIAGGVVSAAVLSAPAIMASESALSTIGGAAVNVGVRTTNDMQDGRRNEPYWKYGSDVLFGGATGYYTAGTGIAKTLGVSAFSSTVEGVFVDRSLQSKQVAANTIASGVGWGAGRVVGSALSTPAVSQSVNQQLVPALSQLVQSLAEYTATLVANKATGAGSSNK